MWDYIIVGAGPGGLSMAYYLSHYGKKVLILERENSIGGCHRVRRVDGMFTEHGPRIYIDNYVVFRDLLENLGLDYEKMFAPYLFSMSSIGGQSIHNIKTIELLQLVKAFFKHIANPEWSKSTSVLEFMDKHNFSISSKDYIDRLCRLTDGAGADRYTMHEFLEIVNQNIFYQIRQPTKPNDQILFPTWENALLKTGNVEIKLNSNIRGIDLDLSDPQHKISGVYTDDHQKYSAKNVIFTIAPQSMMNLLSKSIDHSIKNAFGQFNILNKWAIDSKYIVYIPITYHWDTKIKFPKMYGFPKNEWGLAFINLTDYMEMEDSRSKTVISVCITITNTVSKFTRKTADQSTEEELKTEVYRQLSLPENTPTPTTVILSPGVYYNQSIKQWETKDSAFMLTKAGFGPTNSQIFSNLYWTGTHSGKSPYGFTAMEAALANSLYLAHELIPEIKNKFPIRKAITLVDVSKIIFIIVTLLFFLFYRSR